MHIKTILLTQAEIEIGDGLPDIRLTVKCLEALKQAGFEVRREVFLSFWNLIASEWIFVLIIFVSSFLWPKVIWEKDLAKDVKESPLPWYLPLDKSRISLSSFRLTAVGRVFTKNMVWFLRYYGKPLSSVAFYAA